MCRRIVFFRARPAPEILAGEGGGSGCTTCFGREIRRRKGGREIPEGGRKGEIPEGGREILEGGRGRYRMKASRLPSTKVIFYIL